LNHTDILQTEKTVTRKQYKNETAFENFFYQESQGKFIKSREFTLNVFAEKILTVAISSKMTIFVIYNMVLLHTLLGSIIRFRKKISTL
jgi:hypothetical protein